MCVCMCVRGELEMSVIKEQEVYDWKGKKATTEEAQGLYDFGDKCLGDNEE